MSCRRRFGVAALLALTAIGGTAQAATPKHRTEWHVRSLGVYSARAETAPATIDLTVVDVNSKLNPDALLRAEQHVGRVADTTLSAEWGTAHIQFVSHGGWPVYLEGSSLFDPQGQDLGSTAGETGYHAVSRTGTPYAVVSASNQIDDWQNAFSHEIYEMVVDPHLDRYLNGQIVEVCDPLEYQTSWWANFVAPSYFDN